MTSRLLTVLTLAALPAGAQAQGMAAMQPLYNASKSWLVRSAELMPEADYGFKPTPQVRSFGEIIGHLANANYAICAAAKGESSPANQDFEKAAGKAALVKAVKDALAYCDPVYAMSDAALGSQVQLFGMTMTRLGAAFMNVTHNNEHYGNLVTYFRLKGMVPPSTQGGM